MFSWKLLVFRKHCLYIFPCLAVFTVFLNFHFGSNGYGSVARLRGLTKSDGATKISKLKMEQTTYVNRSAPGSTTENPSRFKEFGQALSSTQTQAMIKLTQAFDSALTSANISYAMCGGTLMGSIRHHGKVPWDDDIDVLINFKDRKAAESALHGFQSIFRYVQFSNELGKFYSIKGKPYSKFSHTYPFIDVWFYMVNGTHVIYSNVDGLPSWRRIVMPKQYYFPLVRRPFEGLSLLSPCNPSETLKAAGVDVSVCRSRHYNHVLEEAFDEPKEMPCDKLRKYYPFVRIRELNESHVLESLEYNNSVIQQSLSQKVC